MELRWNGTGRSEDIKREERKCFERKCYTGFGEITEIGDRSAAKVWRYSEPSASCIGDTSADADSDRAAQFAPFAALTGYKEAIEETERLAEKKIEREYE